MEYFRSVAFKATQFRCVTASEAVPETVSTAKDNVAPTVASISVDSINSKPQQQEQN